MVRLIENLPRDFPYKNLNVAENEHFDKQVFERDSEDKNHEFLDNQQYNADNASMRSATVQDEIDIVDIYKNKMKSNIKLKKKNLQLIFFLFLTSFCGTLLLSGASAYFLKGGTKFIFEDTFANGIVTTQSTASYIFALSFFAQAQFLKKQSTQFDKNLANSVKNSSASGPTTLDLFGQISDQEFDFLLKNYYNYTMKSISKFIQAGPAHHTQLQNSIDKFLYQSNQTWALNRTFSIRGTFVNYLKQVFIQSKLENFQNFTETSADFVNLNFPQLITSLNDLEAHLDFDLDSSLEKTGNFLDIFLLVGWAQ